MVSAKSSCRDIMCESVPGSPPPFLFSVGARGEPGNEASITLCTYLSQTHRPIELHCMHYGITLWAYLSEPLDSHKRPSSTEKSQYRYTACSKSRDHTLLLRTCYGEVYGNIAREENG